MHLREDELPEIFYKKLSYIFVEIPSFNKGLDELDTELDKWLYLLKNMSKLKEIPVTLSSEVFKKVFDIADVSKLTQEELMRYKQEQMAQWDAYADLDTAKKEGREEGMGIGEEKIIRNLLESGKFNVDEVALYARVPEAVVRKVKKSMQKS